MRCRAMYKQDNHYNLIFFKSKGTKYPYQIVVSFLFSKDDATLEKREVIYDNYFVKHPETDHYKSDTAQIIDFGDGSYFEYKFDLYKLYPNNRQSKYYDLVLHRDLGTYTKCIVTFYMFSMEQVYEPTGSPSANGYYEKSGDDYVLSLDSVVILNKVYYTKRQFIISSNNIILSSASGEYKIDEIDFGKFCLAEKTEYNYGEREEGVAYSLMQRLSIIKGELWYLINYGIPLLDKVRNKNVFDSVIINIILDHPDVKSIIYFASDVKDHRYIFSANIDTIYNQTVTISNSLAV